jgi:hypothetical protein
MSNARRSTPSTTVRRAMPPKSCIITSPQASPAQPEKAGLNLRPKSWQSGWPSRKRKSAAA